MAAKIMFEFADARPGNERQYSPAVNLRVYIL